MTANIIHTIGLFLALIPIIVLFLVRRELFGVLLKDSRLSRILHYLLLAVFGGSLYVESYQDFLQVPILLRFCLFFFLLFYAGQFAIVINNIEDLEVDKLTNPDRPLVKAQIAQPLYRTIAWFCLLFALSLALFIGFLEFATISAITLVYYAYSAKPLKLKRYVILAKFLIGINSFFAAVYGFLLLGGTPEAFPVSWNIFILIPISLMANFVDLKDTEGDRLAKVNTLPVLVGQKRATYLIALFTLITYAYAGILFNNLWVYLPISILALLHIYLLFKQPYKEGPLFILHNSLFFGLIILLLILK